MKLSINLSGKVFNEEKENIKCEENFRIKMGNPKGTQESIWTENENKELFLLYKKHGSQWPCISKKLKSHTPNQIKNQFYGLLRREAKKSEELLGYPKKFDKKSLLPFVDKILQPQTGV